MEQKHVLLSALSVGVGLGVGLGLSTGQKLVGSNGVSDEISEEQIVHELKNIVDGKDTNVTFEDFPYYLCKRVQIMLINAGYVYLKQDLSKHMKFLPSECRAILLSGPAELYHQTLAKALANYFGSKLLLLDVTDFSLKMQRKYGCPRKELYLKRSIYDMTVEQVSGLLSSLSILSSTDKTIGTMHRQNSGNENSFSPHKVLSRSASNASDSTNSQNGQSDSDPLKHRSRFCFDEKLFVQSLYKVLVSISETGSIILYIKDVDKLLLRSPRFYNLFQKLIKKLSGSVLVLGSKVDSEDDDTDDEKLALLFPYDILIKPPEDEIPLKTWKSKLEENEKKIQFQDGRNHIAEVLAAKDIDCDDLDSVCHADITQLDDGIEAIVMLAISKHLMDTKHPQYRNGKLVISAKSLSHVLTLFTECESETKTKDSNKDVPPDNEFERRIRAELVPANEMAVTFADIGALDDVKESLQEAVMLPFRRPDLFKGGLLKPYRGILLFGPPGTGKTMLAKAIAKEAGASFINISISTITSKWYGDDEKTVRALFSLAAKVAPTIIFIDEVDGMLGKRSSYSEHEAMRKVKNEFMTHWDGLLSKPSARILVLAATNMPFDLDEAIIRRFERRIMVGLPSAESREKILKTLLAKEKCENNIDFKELSAMTEGYTGSDLKNLCTTAAYRPVRELLQQEMLKEKEKKKEAEVKSSENGSTSKEDKKEQDKKMEAEVQSSGNASNAIENKEEQLIPLRPLNMDDLRQAKSPVAASFAGDGSITRQLKEWNDLYGEGGSRKKQELTYFL